MNRVLWFDQCELQIDITRCVSKAADPTSWDSDWDYYGYREMDFTIVSGIAYDENDENPVPMTRTQIDVLINQYADEIEQKLWEQLDDEKEDYDEY